MTRRNDVVLAGLLIAIIFMMILPMPTVIVDTLIAINMMIAAILLMVVIYLPSPLSFTAFPALLLISTLFRLSLSITTTRLILLQADAGQIVETFGQFVVGGNLIVGIVIFLIITIVQFVVITKGAERVAEVAARFTLDAMPGKQMSIDGDMRAGTIEMSDARKRRSEVERESQLYGAMDGAMKFVKGDAIAGLLIILVNIVGGIAVGTLQHGMQTGEALEIYSVLTVGDGLVSQIPALLISITSGIMVTRVSDDDVRLNLGDDIGKQILGEPRALLVSAAILVGFAAIPGFPTAIFLMLAVAIGIVGLVLIRRDSRSRKRQDIPGLVESTALTSASSANKGATGKKELEKQAMAFDEEEITFVKPLMLDVSPKVRDILNAHELDDALVQLRRALYLDLGVPFPAVYLRYVATMSPDHYVIHINETPVVHGHMRPGRLFVREPAEDLEVASIQYETGPAFLPTLPTVWVDEKYKRRLDDNGLTYFEPVEIVTYHISSVVKRHVETFLGIQETKRIMDRMEQQYDELVREALRNVSLQKTAELLKRLVVEGVSIRNMRLILETICEWAKKEKDTILLVEYIRIALGRQICSRHRNNQNVLPAYILSPDTEQVVRDSIRQTSSGSYLAMPPNQVRKFIELIRNEVGDITSMEYPPVLLCSMDVRRYIRRAIEQDLYELHVISFQELSHDANVQTLGRINMSESGASAAGQSPEMAAAS